MPQLFRQGLNRVSASTRITLVPNKQIILMEHPHGLVHLSRPPSLFRELQLCSAKTLRQRAGVLCRLLQDCGVFTGELAVEHLGGKVVYNLLQHTRIPLEARSE